MRSQVLKSIYNREYYGKKKTERFGAGRPSQIFFIEERATELADINIESHLNHEP